MKITKTDHITISVTDMEKSVRFYEEVLGLEKQEYVDMGDHALQYFALPGTRLELITYKFDSEEMHPSIYTRGLYRHLGLEVEGLDAWYEKLLGLGVPIAEKPGLVEKLSFRNILIKDPNGVEIELLERI